MAVENRSRPQNMAGRARKRARQQGAIDTRWLAGYDRWKNPLSLTMFII
jgi:hypothetical protein